MRTYLYGVVATSFLTLAISQTHVQALANELPKTTIGLTVNKDVTFPELTLEQAIKSAIATSYDVKMEDQGIERNDIIMDDASDALDYTPIGTGNGEDDSAIRSAFKKVSSSNINYQMANKEAEVTKDQVTYSVKKAYYDVLLKEINLKNSEDALELAKLDEKIALAKASIGKIAKYEKEKKIKARVEAEGNLQLAKTQLQDAFVKLNTWMGKSKSQQYILTHKPTYEVSKISDIDLYVNRALSSSPSIWLLEKKIDLAKLDVSLFSFNAGQSYDLEEMDVNDAGLTLASSKEQLEKSIRDTYSSLKQLEEQYQILTSSFETASEDLRVAQVKYAKGFVTSGDLTKAQVAVNQKQREMEQIVLQMDQLRDALEKPWVG